MREKLKKKSYIPKYLNLCNKSPLYVPAMDLNVDFLHHFFDIFISDLHPDFSECRLQLTSINITEKISAKFVRTHS